ncbi:MAG: hypothetical protein JO245_12090 [Pseudolabrys sp.]|nr:hypothetical protein [Pseudolabrys sp.]
MMNIAIAAWLFVRAIRWLAWIMFLGWGAHYLLYPQVHLTQFRHLLLSTELAMFGFSLLAVFAGFIELALRERTGLTRPAFGQLIPPRETQQLKAR